MCRQTLRHEIESIYQSISQEITLLRSATVIVNSGYHDTSVLLARHTNIQCKVEFSQYIEYQAQSTCIVHIAGLS